MIAGGPGITPVSMSSMMDDDARLTSDREVVRRMARMLTPYKLRFVWSFVLITAASGATLVQPKLIGNSIDAIRNGQLGQLYLLAVAYLETLIVFWAASYYLTWILSWVGQ